MVLISDMDISDCHLEIINYFHHQFGEVSILTLFLLSRFFDKIVKDAFAVTLQLFFATLNYLYVLAFPLSLWELVNH